MQAASWTAEHWPDHFALGSLADDGSDPDEERFGWQVNGSDATSAYRSLGEGTKGLDDLLQPGDLVRYETGPEGYNPVVHYGVTEVPTEQRSFALTVGHAVDFIAGAILAIGAQTAGIGSRFRR